MIRIIDADTTMYVKKVYNVHTECCDIAFVNSTNMREMLRKIKLWRNNDSTRGCLSASETKTMITVYDVMIENMSPLLIKGIKFNSKDEKVMSIFHGLNTQYLKN